MTSWRLIVGPPGTGKTTELLRVLRQEIDGGVHPSRIAFLSFTRAARLEALTRVSAELGLNEDDMPWLRTVHSAAYRLLHIRPEAIMLQEEWREFAGMYGYQLTDLFAADEVGVPMEPAARTAHDGLRWVLSWGRCRRLSLKATHDEAPMRVHGDKLSLFADRYDRFRAERGLLDFTDMVEAVIERGLGPSIDVALIDEAQDLSPLEIAAIEIWTASAERVYVAGDPSQALYSFKGATPEWMLSLSTQAQTRVLEQSYRVPQAAHALSTLIIERGTNRLGTRYLAAPRAGVVDRGVELTTALDRIGDGGAFVLSRNRYFLRAASAHLFRKARPYVVEGGRGGPNPLASTRLLRAVRTALSLHKGVERIDHADVEALLSCVPTSTGLVAPGARAAVGKMRGILDVPATAISMGFAPLLAQLALHPTKPLTGLNAAYRSYFQTLIDRHGEIPAPKIRLMTMHASKGREHDHVVLLSDHTGEVDKDCRHGDWEAEDRIRYVAVTRTKERLTICRPLGRKYYPYPVDRRTA